MSWKCFGEKEASQCLVVPLNPGALRHQKLKCLSVLPKCQPFQILADRLVSEENGKTAGEKGSCLLSPRRLKQHIPFQPVLARCIDCRPCFLIILFSSASCPACSHSFPPAFKASCCFPPCRKRQFLNTSSACGTGIMMSLGRDFLSCGPCQHTATLMEIRYLPK